MIDHRDALDLHARVQRETTGTDRMLRNTGGGVFQDVTATTRLDGHGRDTAATIWFDVDRDGNIGQPAPIGTEHGELDHRTRGIDRSRPVRRGSRIKI